MKPQRLIPLLLFIGLVGPALHVHAADTAHGLDAPAQPMPEGERMTRLLLQLAERVAGLEARLAGTWVPDYGDFRPQGQPESSIDTGLLPVIGDPAAPLAIVEVTDYRCPYCRAHSIEVFPSVHADWIAAGRAAYFVLNYSSPAHAPAAEAALAAACANRQGGFAAFHERLFDAVAGDAVDVLSELAAETGLDPRAFDDCRGAPEVRSELERQRNLAEQLGVRGTPTFLVGRLQPDGMLTDMTVLAGLQSLENFRAVLQGYSGP